jgi:translation initiation factor 1
LWKCDLLAYTGSPAKKTANSMTNNAKKSNATTGSSTEKPVTAMPSTGPINTPFSALAALRDSLPPDPAPGSSPAVAVRPKGPARAVVRLEKKGRGGKEATYIEKLELNPKELELWCKALKQAMGCGGSVEDGAIILQGDLRQRLPAVLTERGVRKVTVSG